MRGEGFEPTNPLREQILSLPELARLSDPRKGVPQNRKSFYKSTSQLSSRSLY